MNVDLEAALRYPFEADDWMRTVGIGGGMFLVLIALGFFSFILGLIPILGTLILLVAMPVLFVLYILVTVAVGGYSLRIMRTTIQGSDVPPSFNDARQLLRDGAYLIAIGFVYMLPLAVVWALFMVVALAGIVATSESGSGSAIFFFGYLGTLGVTVLYSIAVAYVGPISACIFAHEDDLRAAFSWDRIKTIATDKRYALVWVIAYVGSQIANQLAGFMMLLLVGFFLQFIIAMIYARLLALGYADAADLRQDGGTGSDDGGRNGDDGPDDNTERHQRHAAGATDSQTGDRGTFGDAT